MADVVSFLTGSLANKDNPAKKKGQVLFATSSTDGKIYFDLNNTTRIPMNAEKADVATSVQGSLEIDGNSFDGSINLVSGNTVRYIAPTGTAATKSGSNYVPALWTANIKNFNLESGAMIAVKMPTAGHDYGIWLSVDNGSNYKPIAQTAQGTSRLTTHYPVGNVLLMVYDAEHRCDGVFPVTGGTSRSNITGSWVVINGFNSDNIETYTEYMGETTGTIGLVANSILMRTVTNKMDSIVSVSNTATTKSKNSEKFMIGSKIWWTNYTVARDTALQSSWRSIYSFKRRIDFRYSSNCGTTLVAGKPVYLVGTIAGGGFILDDTWWTQTLPTSEDGKVYVLVGGAYNTYQVGLYENNEWIEYKNGGLRPISFGSTYATSKLVKTTVPNITGVGTLPTLGNAISADDITAWSAGTTPTLGTAIKADDITSWSAGTTPTLGDAISADDITGWTTNTPTGASVSNSVLKISLGSAASLAYTSRTIPNVTSVGTAPSLKYTEKTIPNVTSVGTAPSLAYTPRTIPNVTGVGTLPTLGTAITVATGSVATNGTGAEVVTEASNN